MFKSLSERLNNTFEKVIGQGRIKESHLVKTLSDIRKALLEADVSLPVAKDFVAKMRRRLLGEEVAKSLNPGQTIIKIAKEELTTLMGESCSELNLKSQPPVVILMAGLQGSGKTTSTAKLARMLKEKHKKKVMVVSTDIYRPAAIKQLETLAQEIEVTWFPSDESQQPIIIAKNAYEQAQSSATDVLIVDTAGRPHIDAEMMSEIKSLNDSLNPTETLFVVDSMTGQDATNTAKAFHDALPLTGVILTKTDGDARGGAALSIRQITDTPIKFLGSGEKTDALEAFHPERMASRILGMGDVLSLIEDLEKNVDKDRFYLQIETFDPHEPFFTTSEWKHLYPHKYDGPEWDWPPYRPLLESDEMVNHMRCEFAALITLCDAMSGRVLDFFDRHNMWEDTMLIVNTDHGFLMGEKDWWAKVYNPLFDEIANIPFYVWDPRHYDDEKDASPVVL